MLNELINSGLSKELIVVIIAALPIAELRGALPVAIGIFDMPWYKALYLSLIGNILPVPFILLFFSAVAKLVSRVQIGKRFIDWVVKRTWRQTKIIEKYKYFGLIVFVAIPLPLTGAWTASLVAYLLGLRFVPAFLSITIGVIGAGAIVLALIFMGWTGAAVALAGLIILAALGLWKL